MKRNYFIFEATTNENGILELRRTLPSHAHQGENGGWPEEQHARVHLRKAIDSGEVEKGVEHVILELRYRD